MANSLLTISMITREALRILHNNLTFTKGVNRQYDDKFAQSGAKIGSSLDIRLPNRYVVTDGATLDVQDTDEEVVTLNITTRKHIGVEFTTNDLTLSLDDFGQRILAPQMPRLASAIDADGLALVNEVYNQVGAPGTTPGDGTDPALVYLQAGQKLNEFAAPRDDKRFMCINPAAEAQTVNGLSGLFQAADKISAQYTRGRMGTGLGFEFGMDQNVSNHTNGTFAGTVLVDDTVVSGDTTIGLDAFTAAAPVLNKGDIFTIADVNAVNPETGLDTGSLQQFVVTAQITGASNEITAVSVSPAFIDSGAKKTITALPANDAAVTFAGAESIVYPLNIAHHRDAFVLGTADLVLPNGTDLAARESYDGISMRVVRDYDIVNDVIVCRVDILYGWLLARPELACRVAG